MRSLARVLLLAGLLASTSAHAQNVGTAYSGPATGDGSAPYYNPAAMNLGDSLIQLDLGLSVVGLTYDPEGTPAAVDAAPLRPYITLGAYTDALHPSLRLGLNLTIPATSGGDWSTDSEAAPITRYYLNSGTQIHASATPAISYAPIEWLSFGLGAQLTYGTLTSQFDKDFGSQLNMTAGSTAVDSPFPYADPALVAPVQLDGSGFGIGAVFGVVATPTPIFSLGVSVHTPVNIDTEGTLSVEYPDSLVSAVADILPSAELPDLNGVYAATLDLPWTVHVGAVVRPIPELELSLYYRWENLSSAPFWNVAIIEATSDSIVDSGRIQGYNDRHFFQLRVGYDPIAPLNLSLFGSFQSDTVPDITVSPNNLDFDRIEVGIAAQYRVSRRVSLLAQYAHLFLVTRDITESLHRPLAQPALANYNHPSPAGQYSGSSDAFRISLILHFDRSSADADENEDAEVEDASENDGVVPDPTPNDDVAADLGDGTEPSSVEQVDGAAAAGSEDSNGVEDSSGEPAWYER